jgi:hypothetical protein
LNAQGGDKLGPATYDANYSAIKDRKDFNANLPLQNVSPFREMSHFKAVMHDAPE